MKNSLKKSKKSEKIGVPELKNVVPELVEGPKNLSFSSFRYLQV